MTAEKVMGKVADKFKKVSAKCAICGKGPVASYNKPHSLHKTKRTIKANIQKVQGKKICTGCLKTLNKQKS